LPESILTIPRHQLPAAWLPAYGSVRLTLEALLAGLSGLPCRGRERPAAETDPSHKQPIPYILIRHGDCFACYERKGSEGRLHGLVSLGIGGHLSPEDGADWETAIRRGLARELAEELPGLADRAADAAFLGLINDDGNPVGQVHLGLVFVLEIDDPAGLTGSDEIRAPRLAARSEIGGFALETWSQLALELG
jgi:predicted NUDIX family phosphoesterase